MATVPKSRPQSPASALPPLENGDHLDQPTFHQRYQAMPRNMKAELIGGIVYMAASQKRPHGRSQMLVAHWLGEYEAATPGTEAHINTTNILGPANEPQPDCALIVQPEFGGQMRENADGFLVGAPELAIEVSSSSQSIDLNQKLRDYEQFGVQEYIVVALRRNEVFWFARKRNKFQPLPVGKDGILHSGMFPGLWLDPAALLERERQQLLTVLRAGLESPAHQAFVGKLAKKKA